MGRQKNTAEAPAPAAYHHGDLREALVQAGIDILEEKGMAALTLRETARRAGVSHAAPYHHFADKEALLAAVAARGFRIQKQEMDAAARNGNQPIDALQAYGLTYASFAQAHPSLFRLMYSHERCTPNASPELVEASEGVYPSMLNGIRERTGCSLEEAQTIALTLWATMHGLTMLWLDNQLQWQGAPPLNVLAINVTEILGRILTRPAPPAP